MMNDKIKKIEDFSKPARKPNSKAADASLSSKLKTVRASQVTQRPVEWLWPGRIPLGKISVIAGDPGLGKSLLTINMSAIVTTGVVWPDRGVHSSVGRVLLLSAEDDKEDTIVPRLAAAGANLERVEIIECAQVVDLHGELIEHEVNIIQHAPMLMNLIEANPDTRLVIIDPVSAFLEGADTHKNAEVRAALKPLARVAMQRRVAVVCISHLNKARSRSVHAISGSVAFSAVARSVYGVVKDAENLQRRLFLPIKANLNQDHSGLAYSILGDPSVIEWEPEPVENHIDDLMREGEVIEGGALSDTKEWLKAQLEPGPKLQKDIRREADSDGFAWRTVERAKRELGYHAGKRTYESGWFWSTHPLKKDGP